MGLPVLSSHATNWKLDGTNFKLLYGAKKAEKKVPVFKLRASADDASLTWNQRLYASGKYAPYGKDNSATLFFGDGTNFDFSVTSPEGEEYEFTAEIDYVTPSPRRKIVDSPEKDKKEIDFQFKLVKGSINKFLEFASYYDPEKYSGDIASESTALARSAASFRNPSTWMWRGGSRMGNRGYYATFIHRGSDHGRPTQHVRLTSYCTRNNFPYRDGHHRECVRNHHFFRGIPTDEWQGWNFGATNAFRTHLVEFQLRRTKWNGSDFTESVLSGSNFGGAQFRDVTFNRARMLNTNFHGADMRGATFNGANISVRDWRGANLQDTDWINANVRRHRSERSTFQNADFTGANLTGAQFDRNLDFSGANFTDVICPNGTQSNGRVCDFANM